MVKCWLGQSNVDSAIFPENIQSFLQQGTEQPGLTEQLPTLVGLDHRPSNVPSDLNSLNWLGLGCNVGLILQTGGESRWTGKRCKIPQARTSWANSPVWRCLSLTRDRHGTLQGFFILLERQNTQRENSQWSPPRERRDEGFSKHKQFSSRKWWRWTVHSLGLLWSEIQS